MAGPGPYLYQTTTVVWTRQLLIRFPGDTPQQAMGTHHSKLVHSDLWYLTRKCTRGSEGSSRSQPRSLGNVPFPFAYLSAQCTFIRLQRKVKCSSEEHWSGPQATVPSGDGLQLSPDVLGVSKGLLMSPACRLALQLPMHILPVLVH